MKQQPQGFTLLEVMVSMCIFMVVSATMANSFMGHLKQNSSTEVRNGAVAAAQQKLDTLRLIDPPAMPSSGSTTESLASGGRSFSVKTLYCLTPTYCTSNNSRDITVRVSYRGKQVYETETVYTRLR